ncbi:L-rhamnose catabolism isomerase [Neomegalonema sp.]|uniref:L-rhamnose catabolism isomerase n=1 Tax=Neomegalonema sp. TaxID=2039713 RepID=UPI00261606E6|nr:L-rhamnose catabolism isomerase [Neomegalonema sp.]MDD2868310.1 L-rhamnose catabolism isomerase [Neomegalonema sp.]
MKIQDSVLGEANARREADLRRDYESLGERLARRGIAIDAIKAKIAAFGIALPSWAAGTGGTRFARFPGAGEPRDVFDKIDDCGAVHRLTGLAPAISLHIPWDKADPAALLARAGEHGLIFDAVNSNTFQDHPDLPLSFKYGSLSHVDKAVRDQAVAHNLDCVELGRKIGSKALSIWIGDGSNFPGQADFTRQLDRYLESAHRIYAGLPEDWRLFVEHKMYEPAFYSTVVQDWGTSYLIAQELGAKAACLVDLGHHAPNVNIEMIVARLIRFGKLAGFHFNDSKYGDDDLDAGVIDPYRLFLVFNELVNAEGTPGFSPAYMLDESHNVTDPLESMMASAMEVARAHAQALLVDRAALRAHQESNDALMASETLKTAFRTDVEPILAMARLEKGAAIDPVAAFRALGYRAQAAAQRPKVSGAGGGIV